MYQTFRGCTWKQRRHQKIFLGESTKNYEISRKPSKLNLCLSCRPFFGIKWHYTKSWSPQASSKVRRKFVNEKEWTTARTGSSYFINERVKLPYYV